MVKAPLIPDTFFVTCSLCPSVAIGKTSMIIICMKTNEGDEPQRNEHAPLQLGPIMAKGSGFDYFGYEGG